jgi:thiol-disulfide isomerase/thioredoxin
MNYLKFIGGIALALGILPGSVSAQDSTYTLHGRIRGLDTGWVFLYHPGDGPTDSTLVSRGQFHFTGSIKEPELCHLVFKKLNRDNIYSLPFFIQAGAPELTGTKDSISSAVPSGAPIQEEYFAYQQKEKSIIAQINWDTWGSAYDAAGKAKKKSRTDSLLAVRLENYKLRVKFAKDYAAAHPSSYVAVEEIREYYGYDPDAIELQGIYNGFTPELQSSHLGKLLKKTLDAALLTGVGRPAPDFTQTDIKGKPVALSSFKGQYVLVDFWASWCGPCREENPNVLKSYRAYHSKGFTVLGVSLDDEKSPWIGAVRKDDLPWMQVSDLKGWKNSAAVLYDIEGIPMNYLLDKNGIIVAKGLRGDELEQKLAELLH